MDKDIIQMLLYVRPPILFLHYDLTLKLELDNVHH